MKQDAEIQYVEKFSVERTKIRCEDNIKINLREIATLDCWLLALFVLRT
jgi:hypothetical protein